MFKKQKRKQKIQLAVLAVLAIVLGFTSFATFQSDDLEGKARNRNRNRSVQQPTQSMQIAQPPAESSSTNSPTGFSQGNSANPNMTATFTPYGYSNQMGKNIRYHNVDQCTYFMEMGKWKLDIVGGSLNLQRIPFRIYMNSGGDAPVSEYKLSISQNPTGFDPIHTFSHSPEDALFEFPIPSGTVLGAGTYYVTMDGLYEEYNYAQGVNGLDGDQGSILITNGQGFTTGSLLNSTLGNFSASNQSGLAELGSSVIVPSSDVKFLVKRANQSIAGNICNKSVDAGAGGNIGKVTFIPATPYASGAVQLNSCSASSDWAPIGQWEIQLRKNHLQMMRAQFFVAHHASGASISDEYRVFISKTPNNYRQSPSKIRQGHTSDTAQSVTISSRNNVHQTTTADVVSIDLFNPADLEFFPLQATQQRAYAENHDEMDHTKYYMTLEAKPKPLNSQYSTNVRVSNDDDFRWGTFGKGLYWQQPAKMRHDNVLQANLGSNPHSWSIVRNVHYTGTAECDFASFR